MSLLQLGINGISLARDEMEEKFEKMVKNAGSMNAKRALAGWKVQRTVRQSPAAARAAVRAAADKEAANAAADASERSEEESSDEEDDSSDEEDDTEGESAESGEEAADEESGEEEEAADEGSGEEGESAKRQRRQSGDGQTTAEDEAATLQSEFMKAWKEAVKLPAQVVGDRWEQLELKGKRVIVHESAPAEDIAELHAALRELDDAFDPSFSTQADLKKMPVLKELLEDPTHCTNSTYLFELFSCGKEGCKFGCQKWEAVEPNSAAAACQMQLKQRTPLPQLDRTREHYLPYHE